MTNALGADVLGAISRGLANRQTITAQDNQSRVQSLLSSGNVKQAAAIDPVQATNYQSVVSNMNAEQALEAQRKVQPILGMFEYVENGGPPEQKGARYEAFLQEANRQGLDVADAPPPGSPGIDAYISSKLSEGLTFEGFLEQKIAQQNADTSEFSAVSTAKNQASNAATNRMNAETNRFNATKPRQVTKSELERLVEARDRFPEGSDQRKFVEARIRKLTESGAGLSITTPDGTVIQQGGGRDFVRGSAKINQESQKLARDANSSVAMLDTLDELLDSGLDTGKFAGTQKLLSELGDFAGIESQSKKAELYQRFDAVSKKLGIQALQLVGGNDTERELIVAIQTGPEISKTDKANREIINDFRSAVEILMTRPDFESDWINRNGTLTSPDQATGEYFGKAWRRFQREQFGSESEPASSDDPLGLR